MNRRQIFLLTFLGTLLVFGGVFYHILYKGNQVWNPVEFFKKEDNEHKVGQFSVIKDEKGNLVTKLGRKVSVGDSLISAEGKSYQVYKVADNSGYARFVEIDREFLAWQNYFSKQSVPVATKPWMKRDVGIYHTHTDESYVPTDGKASIPYNGGIFQVGDTYANKLLTERVNIRHDKTPNEPHDNNAYIRSRRTVMRLMRLNPVALFDVHRDGIPDADFYRRNIKGEDVSQIRLVVGRQNPHFSANLEFAKRLMAYANKINPKIVKEVYVAKGNYNQDLMPTSLLIEAGTHLNTKGEAQRGIALLADAVPVVLGVGTGAGTPGSFTGRTTNTPGTWRAIGLIIAITLIGGAAFLVISAGGWQKALERLKHFRGKEFADLLKPLRKRLK